MITEQEFLEYAKANDYYVKKKNHNKCRDCKWFEKDKRYKDKTRGTGQCRHPYVDRGGRYFGDVACIDFDDGSGNERFEMFKAWEEMAKEG